MDDRNSEDGENAEETLEEKLARVEEENEKLRSERESVKSLRKQANKKEREKETLEDRLLVIEEQRQRELELKTTAIDEAKSIFMKKHAGEDENEKAKIQYEYDLLNMPEDTPAQVETKFEKAASMVYRNDAPNPLNAGYPTSSAPLGAVSGKKEFVDSSDGEALSRRLGMGDIIDARKKS